MPEAAARPPLSLGQAPAGDVRRSASAGPRPVSAPTYDSAHHGSHDLDMQLACCAFTCWRSPCQGESFLPYRSFAGLGAALQQQRSLVRGRSAGYGGRGNTGGEELSGRGRGGRGPARGRGRGDPGHLT